jgi:hypothetical protein
MCVSTILVLKETICNGSSSLVVSPRQPERIIDYGRAQAAVRRS